MMLLLKRQRREFAVAMLLIHLYTHEDLPEAATECRIDHLTDHVSWSEEHAQHVVRIAVKNNHAVRDGSFLRLTDRGRETARHAIVNFSPSASS